jgi:hypothetical protein
MQRVDVTNRKHGSHALDLEGISGIVSMFTRPAAD